MDSTEKKFFAIISYIGFFCIVALLFKKEDEFVRHHAKQGLILFVLEVICWFFSAIPLLNILAGICYALFLMVSLWGMFKALRGETLTVPVLTDFSEKITL